VRQALLVLLFALPPGAGAACPVRMLEPRLVDLETAARRLPPDAYATALASDDRAVHDLAATASWYSARANGDTEARTQATAQLFEIWDRHRPAGRLMRIVSAGLEDEGWPAPEPVTIERRLSQLGDRDAVLARARAVTEAEGVDSGTLREALRGATVMALRQDGEALRLMGALLDRLEDTVPAAETVLFRAELGDAAALRELAERYRAVDVADCAERAALVDALFGPN
jgi:hypothetical protein